MRITVHGAQPGAKISVTRGGQSTVQAESLVPVEIPCVQTEETVVKTRESIPVIEVPPMVSDEETNVVTPAAPVTPSVADLAAAAKKGTI